ncbi:hypothetical protein LGT39_02270 [Demequina sp. TTPB684]|uniref:hypothetical protein n=1 Tax=unclassified Demequina TaxID=2620311 RepID=UPI001CF3485B|nr:MULTISPECIES: hypothetical protein [unclassified Demequina]MCB2411672.1 hypothetical protein [Demequina sp. TTPB684]UPU89242.1 hypothetical protein LGT36_004765 [Demequina sp. TMPB413]
MNPIAQKYGAASLPQVNLVPREIGDRRKMRAVQTFAALAVAAFVALMAIVFVGAYAARSVAEGALDDAFSDEEAALAERDAKRGVYDDYIAQETREMTLLQVGWAEIDYSALATSLLATQDAETSFAELHFYGPSADGIGGGDVAPLWGGGVGRFDFIAQTRTQAQAIALIDRLEAVPGVAKVIQVEQIYEAEAPTQTWKVTGTGVITRTALTGRLIPVNGIIDFSAVDLILEDVDAAPIPVVDDPSEAPADGSSAEPSPSADAESEG